MNPFQSAFSRYLSSPRPGRGKARKRQRKAQRQRPCLEVLEDRLTPSGGNATVTQLAGGFTDLTKAVAADTAAGTNYIINITNSFQFNQGDQVLISHLGAGSTMTIQGNDGNNFTLTGNDDRLFDIVAQGQSVTFKDLTLTGGSTKQLLQVNESLLFTQGKGGGCILDEGGNVTITKTNVVKNSVAGSLSLTVKHLVIPGGASAQGGGIYVAAGNLTIQNGSTIQSNTATGSPAEGAGVYMGGNGNLIVQGGSTIESNQAVGVGGGIASLGGGNTSSGGSASGGGIFVNGTGTVQITDSTFSNNNAKGGPAVSATAKQTASSGGASGGGLYLNVSNTVQITDSTFSNNNAKGGQAANATAQGASGGSGGAASGGGLEVSGSQWAVNLTGDTFSGNTVIGGNGGNGMPGADATAPNTKGGDGGAGGNGGAAQGGAAFFSAVSPLSLLGSGGLFGGGGGAQGSLTILNDSTHASTWIGNSVTAGAGGNGGNGGMSEGSVHSANGGNGGVAGEADGGALAIAPNAPAAPTLFVAIGNTTFYANHADASRGGSGGLVGAGGFGDGTPGKNQPVGAANGGGLDFGSESSSSSGSGNVTGNFTLFDCTVAANTVTSLGVAQGGGVAVAAVAAITLDNNTITQNTGSGATNAGDGLGIWVPGIDRGGTSSNPTLDNNLILGNKSGNGNPAVDLFTNNVQLTNAHDNIIGTMSPAPGFTTSAVNPATNFVGITQTQLGSVVGVDSKGNPTGGPIYYPLLSGVKSIGAGDPSVLSTIASIEETTSTDAADEIGDLRTTTGGIDIGAVGSSNTLAPPPPPPGPPPAPQMVTSYKDLVSAIAADTGRNTHYDIQITKSFSFDSGGQVGLTKLGVGSTLTIEGQNGSNFTLTGNGNRLFDVVGKQQVVTFKDLTLTGGTVTNTKGAAGGGAILIQSGNVTLSKVAVLNNTVSASGTSSGGEVVAGGGGIAVTANGILTVQGGSTIQSNHALAAGSSSSLASGGGVFLTGTSTVQISDSMVSNNSAQSSQGAISEGGGLAAGGFSGGWTVTLTGDIFSGNTAIGGNGASGPAGTNATAANSGGNDGNSGGNGGFAEGGAAFFGSLLGNSTGSVTILSDSTHPSIMIDNSVQGGSGGAGGAGGKSTGTAKNSRGGDGGTAGSAEGGALAINGASNVNIGNTTFYGNKATGGAGGAGGAAGTGGSGAAGTAGTNQSGGIASGGGLLLGGFFGGIGNLTLVNNTVAANTATGGAGGGIAAQGIASGGGIDFAVELGATTSGVLDNNTITQNAISGGASSGGGFSTSGAGLSVSLSSFTPSSPAPSSSASPALLNNLILGNQSTGTSAHDLDVIATISTGAIGSVTSQTGPFPLSNATNNFIGSISSNAVSASTNTIGNSTAQLGKVVGIGSDGKLSGGPVYYPLLPGVASIGAGSSNAVATIAAIEGSTPATDEIGNFLPSSGPVDLGAVQTKSASGPTAPTITTQPANQTASVGSTATFTASASGNPTPTVQWQLSGDGGKTWSNANLPSSNTIFLPNVSLAISGWEVRAVFTNSAGTVTSQAATLTVHAGSPSPSPSSPPSPPAPTPPATLNTPPLLSLFNSLFGGGTVTVNADGSETMTDSFFGIPLLVSTFDASGNLESVTIFGIDITFLFSML